MGIDMARMVRPRTSTTMRPPVAVGEHRGLGEIIDRRGPIGALPLGGEHRDRDPRADGAHHDGQGDHRGDVDHRLQEHLHADEGQDEHQRRLEVAELLHHRRQGEVQRAQAQNGEDVGREDDEGVLGDPEDRGDGVDGEDHVRGLHHHQRQEQRGDRPDPSMGGRNRRAGDGGRKLAPERARTPSGTSMCVKKWSCTYPLVTGKIRRERRTAKLRSGWDVLLPREHELDGGEEQEPRRRRRGSTRTAAPRRRRRRS